jgi:3-hydroxyisobutyrate dehydrogenase
VGSPGSAQLLRAGDSLQGIAGTVAAIESHSLIEAARKSVTGLDLSNLEPHGVTADAKLVLKAIADEDFDSPFTIEMLMAELSAAIMAADDYELILPQAEAAFHLIELLAVIGGSDKNAAAVSLVYGEDKPLNDYGLDWQRAEGLFHQDEDNEFKDDYSDDYIDDTFAEGTGFGYSVN